MAQPVTLYLRGQTFTIDLNEDQLNGLRYFISAYNGRRTGETVYHRNELDDPAMLASLDFYVIDEPEDNGVDDDDEEEEPAYPRNLELSLNRGGRTIIVRDVSREMLQGFITGARWVGESWRDYVVRVTENGDDVVIQD